MLKQCTDSELQRSMWIMSGTRRLRSLWGIRTGVIRDRLYPRWRDEAMENFMYIWRWQCMIWWFGLVSSSMYWYAGSRSFRVYAGGSPLEQSRDLHFGLYSLQLLYKLQVFCIAIAYDCIICSIAMFQQDSPRRHSFGSSLPSSICTEGVRTAHICRYPQAHTVLY